MSTMRTLRYCAGAVFAQRFHRKSFLKQEKFTRFAAKVAKQVYTVKIFAFRRFSLHCKAVPRFRGKLFLPFPHR